MGLCFKSSTNQRWGYILGRPYDSDISTGTGYGAVDYWIIKLDANGNKIWEKFFGGSGGDYLEDLQQTSDGGYILGGDSGSSASGNKTSANYGYWIIKLDENGDKIWEKSFYGSNYGYFNDLQQTRDGGYILGGASWSGISGNKTTPNYGYEDFWIIKLDSNGNKIWEQSFGGSDSDWFNNIWQTSDEGYILGGYSISGISGNKTSTYGYWIIKLDSNGNKVWEKSLGGSFGADYFDGLQQTIDGGYILGGYSYSGVSGNKTSPNYGYQDYWLIKLDINGSKVWDQSFGGSGSDSLHGGLQQTSDGGYILGGYSSSGVSGNKTSPHYGGSDYWIIKLAPEWVTPFANVPPPTQPVYGNCPTKESGKDSLIIVTHGWNPDLTWLEAMTNNIQQYLIAQSLSSWQVFAYKWVESASTGLLPSSAQKALENGKQAGEILGDCLGSQEWSHIHLIAHSAGAGLIQVATERIKILSSNTTVHCTFLDPFVGLDYAGVSQYGTNADLADHYFSRDSLTRNAGLGSRGPLTESLLEHAHNVDVTSLDPNKEILGKFRSSVTGEMEPCVKTVTSHEWPHGFYSNTITGDTTTDYARFGFPLSKEGGGWSSGVPSYTPGNDPAQILGTPDPTCIEIHDYTPPSWVNILIDFTQSPTIQSDTGTIQKWFDSLKLSSGSPAWIATVVSSTNPVNVISFNTQFSSTNGAQGLLSVFWDDQVIGLIDERVFTANHYTFSFSNATANSAHILGFRLDTFTNIQSVVTITNIVLNQVGVSQPFSLSLTGGTTNGALVYELTGEAGFEYHVQASTNLFDWSDIAVLQNTNGAVRFFDQNSTNYPIRFYRGVLPY